MFRYCVKKRGKTWSLITLAKILLSYLFDMLVIVRKLHRIGSSLLVLNRQPRVEIILKLLYMVENLSTNADFKCV